MYIKDVILNTAKLLNLQNVVDYVNNKSEEGNAAEECQKLLGLTNLVLTELFSSNIYVVYEQNITAKGGQIKLTSFHFSIVKLLELYNKNGDKCEYKIFPKYIECSNGEKFVKYAYVPNVELEDIIQLSVSEILAVTIAMGVASEYLLTINDFEQAVYWQEKYQEVIAKYNKPKNTITKVRNFV